MYQVAIVDDEPLIVNGLKNAIDWEGYHFEIGCAVTNPLQVLDYIKYNTVHLLITDISMPELNGIELIKQAKAINPLLSVLVLSAYDVFEYVRSALRYGAENYILKPLDPDELGESIRHIVSHMQQREQLSQTYGVNMLTFRSSFIEHWVKNTFSNQDLKNRASLLGINLNAGNYTVLVFSSVDRNAQQMSHFFDFLLSFLLGQFLGHFYFETPFRLVCILSASDERNKSISSFINQISKSAANMQLYVFIAAGTTVQHYSEVGNSYQNACALSFLQYTHFTNYIYEEINISKNALKKIYHSFESIDFDLYLSSIENLFQDSISIHTATHYTVLSVSWFLQQLGKESEDVLLKFPQLSTKLKAFPSCHAQVSDYKAYTSSFAKECYGQIATSTQSMYPCVDAVIQAIHEFSDKDISLKTIATKLNVSPSYLGSVFRQQTGSYFNDYLTEARLQYALKLIEKTDMKMKDIVDKVGFSSQTYFNRTFKRYHNVSPVTYRRQIRVDHM